MNVQRQKTKLYRLLSFDGTGVADSLFSLLEDTPIEDGIEWDKVFSYASDREDLM